MDEPTAVRGSQAIALASAAIVAFRVDLTG
jgi:hypothetical protein